MMGLAGRLRGCLLACLPACLLALLASVPACGDGIANDEPLACMVACEDPQGTFSMGLLAPPWLPPLQPSSLNGQTVSVVVPSDITTTDLTVILSEALYTMIVAEVPGTPGALAAGL